MNKILPNFVARRLFRKYLKLIFIFLRKHFAFEQFISTTLSLIFAPKRRFAYFAYLRVLYDLRAFFQFYISYDHDRCTMIFSSRETRKFEFLVQKFLTVRGFEFEFRWRRKIMISLRSVDCWHWALEFTSKYGDFFPSFFFYFNRNVETSIRIEIKRRSPSFDLNTQKFS